MKGFLKRYLPLSGPALALWLWRYRGEVVDWTSFGVRSMQNLVSGDKHDIVTEGRLRAALLGDRRTRGAAGLEVRVRDGVAILSGIVDPQAHDVAVKITERAEGVREVDDRVEEIRPS